MDTSYFPQTLGYGPRQAYAPAAKRSSQPLYPWLVALVMATGTVVLIEPAPIDLALIGLLCAGLLFGRLAYVATHELALLLLGAFVAANALSMLNAEDLTRAFGFLMITSYMLCWWLFFAGLPTRYGYRSIALLMNGYVVAGVLSAVLGTAAYLKVIGHQDVLLRYGRPQGLFKDPNVYGPYLVPMLLYAIVRLMAPSKSLMARAAWMGVSVVSAVGVFLAYSRAAWINSVVTVAAYFVIQFLAGDLTRRTLHNMIKVGALVVVIAAGIGYFAAASPVIRSMLEDRLGTHGLHNYDAERFYTHDLARQAVRDHPLGIGPGNSENVFQYSTHSLYLRVLAENGVLGGAAFYLFVALSLLRTLRLARAARSARWRNFFTFLAACIIGLLVNSIVIDTLHWRHFWLLLGLAWASHPEMYQPDTPAQPGAAWQGKAA